MLLSQAIIVRSQADCCKCVRLGPWEENGEQHKCENCKRFNRPCGAGEQTKREETGNISDRKDSGIGEETAMADTSDVEEVRQL
jgi:hypothetical protein